MDQEEQDSRYRRLRARVARLTDPVALSTESRLVRRLDMLLIVWGVLGVLLGDEPAFAAERPLLVDVPLAGFILVFLIRLWVLPDQLGHEMKAAAATRLDWLCSSRGLVDFLGAWAIPAALLCGLPAEDADLFGVLWVFKLARYSQGLSVLWRVIQIEAEPLAGVLFAFMVTLVCAAVLAHLLERTAQPAAFGTVAMSLWWTITTLTTTGYGDVTPVTTAGRMLAGLVMMSGIVVFALWAGILATGFSQEMRRRAFLRTWDLVARVPFFHAVGATVIAAVAQRLRAREVCAGSVVVRKGDAGDCMFFIVEGGVEVHLPDASPRLGNGTFFGEMALISGAPRSATVIATRTTQLLILDIADFRDLAVRYPELSQAIHEEAQNRRHCPTAEGEQQDAEA